MKQAVKDQPCDDAEVERKEEEAIDQVFDETSSEDEEEDDDLTESGMPCTHCPYMSCLSTCTQGRS